MVPFPRSALTSLCVNELWPVLSVSASPSLDELCPLPTVASCDRSLAPFLCLWAVRVSLLWKSESMSGNRPETNCSKKKNAVLSCETHVCVYVIKRLSHTSFSRVTAMTSFIFSLLLLSVVRFVFSCYLLWRLDC